MTRERKIELAIERWFSEEGWVLELDNGDHFATKDIEEVDANFDITSAVKAHLNITSLARAIVEDTE
jgi:hypothetical protein